MTLTAWAKTRNQEMLKMTSEHPHNTTCTSPNAMCDLKEEDGDWVWGGTCLTCEMICPHDHERVRK